jgi:hypothetical protein
LRLRALRENFLIGGIDDQFIIRLRRLTSQTANVPLAARVAGNPRWYWRLCLGASRAVPGNEYPHRRLGGVISLG